MELIPAIIPKDFNDLQDKVSQVVGLVPLVQVDVMDGVFTHSKSWPYKTVSDPDFDAILREEKGFPYWGEMDFEAHLMFARPELVWQDWIKAGAKRIIFHVESLDEPEHFLEDIRKNSVTPDSIFYVEIGLAINIDTPNEILEKLIPFVDFVQFMGIAKIGSQGEPFDSRVLGKIKDFRAKYPTAVISVDGGVSLQNAESLVSAGINRLVAGSAIFNAESISEAIDDFNNVI